MRSIQPQVKYNFNSRLVVNKFLPLDHQRMVEGEGEQPRQFAARLDEALRRAGQKQTWLAEQLGITDQAISKWKITGQVSRERLMKAAKLLNVSPQWLMEGPSKASAVEQEPAAYTLAKGVPIVGSAQLGDDGHFVELQYPVGHGEGYIDFPTRDPNAYAVQCRGHSMRPRIKDREYVIIEPNHSISPGDEVLVKDKSGRVMVKEWLFTRDEQVHLASVNEAHGRIVIPIADIEVMHFMAGIAKSALRRE